MREPTVTEQFMQIVTIEHQRDAFMEDNTSPFADYEADGTPVHRIRYTGISGTRNRWKLR